VHESAGEIATPTHNFNPEAHNRLWSADPTYEWADEGWLYLVAVIDPLKREVVRLPGRFKRCRFSTDDALDESQRLCVRGHGHAAAI
jgi:transposase InsO family protein